jgi:hypothetical protein
MDGWSRYPRAPWWIGPILATVILGPVQAGAPPRDPPPVEFNQEIRPILSDRCFQCHGPDGARRKAKLRLDLEQEARRDLGGRRTIVPGDLDASELYRRITSADADERMPPPAAGEPLTAGQIDRLGRWIRQGAPWQVHWSLIPPRRPPVPPVNRPGWVRNPIDAFVLARLEREGMAPSVEESRAGLLRRLSLDLTGLPPDLSELDGFSTDPRPDAYDHVIERLLASPRFGERMAIRWLNAARYADTNGYQTDGGRTMWRWRDWVIDAYNRNLSSDRFTIEQLAGDLLPSATLEQKIATGFNRNHRGNAEGGIIPEEYAVEYVMDRVETTATVWLGLTIGCARCHNHKFDPISQEEFYRLFAFFNNVPENGRAVKYGNSPPLIKAPTRAQQEQLTVLESRLAAARHRVEAMEPELDAAQSRWEQGLRTRADLDWQPRRRLLVHLSFEGSPRGAAGEATLRRDADAPGEPATTLGPAGRALVLDGRGYLDAGDVGRFGFLDRFTLSAWIRPRGQWGGTVLSRMADEPKGEGYSVVLAGGKVQVNLVKRWLDDAIRVESRALIPADRWTHLAVSYDGSRSASGVSIFLDGREVPTEVLLDELNQTFLTRDPLRIGGGGGLESRFHGAIDEVRVHDAALPAAEIEVLATAATAAEIAAIPRTVRTPGQARKIRAVFLDAGARESFRRRRSELAALQEQLQALLDRVPTTMVMQERPRPRVAQVLIRGQYDRPGARMARGVPACLSPWPEGAPVDRLGLARWLADPAHPLTARVEVNRQWQMLFGTGLVKTVEDFGVQGELPSHPELLDWLATEFARTGWDIKALIRTMVTSATYRQAPGVSPELLSKDPENRLLSRGSRLRLPAEMLRDQSLRLGGLLVERLGGPSVKPYQPAGLWDELADDVYVQNHGPSLYRRSLYTFWKRTVAPPGMVTFDAPGRETCIVRETRTNTPLQALNLMNDVTFVEAARAFAARILQEGGPSPEDRLTWAFRAATSRPPGPEELAVLLAGLRDQESRFRVDPRAARELVDCGESRADPRLDSRELAAYTVAAQVILNLDEVINKE